MRRIRAVPLSVIRPSAVVILTAAAMGCGPKNFENDNDRLRAENLQLQRQVVALEEKAALRAGELEGMRQRLDDGASPLEGATPPGLAAIRLDRYTGTVDTDADGVDDTLRVYLRPVDRDGRLLVLVGRLTVQLVTAREGQPAVTLAEKTFTPAEFDAAYRTGFMGTHYTLELPLPTPLPDAAAGPATVYAHFTEATTGASFTEQRAITVERVVTAVAE